MQKKVELLGRADQSYILQVKFPPRAQSIAEGRKHRGFVRVRGPAPGLEEKSGAILDESLLRRSFACLAHIKFELPPILANAPRL